jgi:hypothetical protein
MQVLTDNGLALWRIMLHRSHQAAAVPVVERYQPLSSERLGARSFSSPPPPQKNTEVRRQPGPAAIPPEQAQFVGRTLDISV